MLGWFRLAAAWASRRNRSTNERVGGELGEQHLDRDRAVEQLVAGEVDLGHAAAGERAVQLVAAVEDDGSCSDMRLAAYVAGAAERRGAGRAGAVDPRGCRTFSITALAIGAATRPPVCSLAPGWPSTSTATATCGCARRAGEADDPGVRLRRVGAELGGAGLAADLDIPGWRGRWRCPAAPPAPWPGASTSAVGGRYRLLPHLRPVAPHQVAVGVPDLERARGGP